MLEKDNPALLMSQNVAATLAHLIISCSFSTFEFSSCNYAPWLSVCQDVETAEKVSLLKPPF